MEARRVAIAGREIRVRADTGARFWDKVEAGAWEPALLAALRGWLPGGALFLDIGAWIGPTALAAAALGAGRVVALEPDPVAAAAFRDNLALNPDLAPRVTLIEAALTATPGPARIGDAGGKRGKSTSSLLRGNGDGAYQVATVTPDALLAEIGNAPEIVIKLDIEGGEYLIFPAAAKLFDTRVRHAHLSLHPAALASRISAAWATRSLFASLAAYDLVAIQGGIARSTPLTTRLARVGLCAWPLGGDWILRRRP
ncbi:MAG: FkbM family methyltransferase [Pseudomonadota bacterium]